MSHSKAGDILEGTVVKIYPKYAILLFENDETGLLHISELTNSYVRNFTSFVQAGNIYKVKVIQYDEEKNFMRVSAKALTPEEKRGPLKKEPIPADKISFEELEKRLPDWIKEQNEGEQL
ncbi:MAG: S1 RNA-binding domain-containing protein [Bacilli bacterium]|nr:S1 RNA-binding domain-containing protein [Bacilli bacterium]